MKKLLILIFCLSFGLSAQYVRTLQDTTDFPITNLFDGRMIVISGITHVYQEGGWYVRGGWSITPTSAFGGEASIDTANLLLSKVNANANFVKIDNIALTNARIPLTHSHVATDIGQTSSYRFTTDAEKTTWNGKQDALGFTPVTNARTLTINSTSYDLTANRSFSVGTIIASDTTLLHNQIVSKQATLVSGTNIKTVNSNSLLGSGDLVISGGSGNGYCLNVQAASQSITTDAQTLYWGGMIVAPSTTANRWRVYIPKSGTIKSVYIYSYSSTAGTSEAWVMNIRKNNTTDTQIASVSLATSDRVWSNVSLSIAVVAGDYIEIKEVCPTWSTNPATVTRTGQIYIE